MVLRYWIESGEARVIYEVERVIYFTEGKIEVTYVVPDGVDKIKLEQHDDFTRFTVTLE